MSRRTPLTVCLLITGWLILSAPAAGQETHVDVLNDLAVSCLNPVVSGHDSLAVRVRGGPGFLETRLYETWLQEGRSVRLAENNTPDGTRPSLSASVDKAAIEFDRIGGGNLRRTASLSMHYRMTSPSGDLLSASSCNDTAVDSMDIEVARSLEDDRFPETQPEIPTTSLLRRIVQPAVVIGAAGLGTYLFFNLRSRRAND